MTCALLLALGVIAPPDAAWRFVDETTFAGRSVLTYRTIELGDQPIIAMHSDDRAPAGSQFSVLALGPGGKRRLGLVWHAATAAVWLDGNADGRFAANERLTLGPEPLTVQVTIPFGDGTDHERTLLIRRRGQGLAYAIRGYTRGMLTLNGKSVAALLTDGNADGCFDGAGVDRIRLDLDGDGRFDPFTEQFPLGSALKVGTGAVLIQPNPDGLAVRVRERPNETGSLVVRVARLVESEVIDLSAQYVSEFGELVTVKSADQAVSMPAGKYRLDSLTVKLADADGQVWRYSFASGERKLSTVVSEKRETTHSPLADLKMDLSITVQSGNFVSVQPDVVAGELYLTSCDMGPKDVERGQEITADIVLCDAGSRVLDRASSGFA